MRPREMAKKRWINRVAKRGLRGAERRGEGRQK